jgi:hypothetical protein
MKNHIRIMTSYLVNISIDMTISQLAVGQSETMNRWNKVIISINLSLLDDISEHELDCYQGRGCVICRNNKPRTPESLIIMDITPKPKITQRRLYK